jgi:hypothetical protein
MDEQPIIWRPNCFTREEWDGLSREQQIQWCKDHWHEGRSPRDPRQYNPLRPVRLYENGTLTQSELVHYVFEHITQDNVDAFLSECPADILLRLRRCANKFPNDDDEERWGRFYFIEGRCFPPWVSAEEIQKADEERMQYFREGLRVFRATGRTVND